MSDVTLELKNIHRRFKQGSEDLHILKGINFSMKAGEVVSLIGASGAGKSTLLHIAGLLEKASEGEVIVSGQSCNSLSDKKRTLIRRSELGFVYQFHHLLPEFNALENVAMPLRVAGQSGRAATKRAGELLEKMGLGARISHRPSQLSGGEQQRVAVARALANRPKILLADEPTGNLDEQTGNQVMEILLDLAHEEGISALIATHNIELSQRMDRCVILRDGLLHE